MDLRPRPFCEWMITCVGILNSWSISHLTKAVPVFPWAASGSS